MKMSRTALSLCLVLALLLCLFGCGEKINSDDGSAWRQVEKHESVFSGEGYYYLMHSVLCFLDTKNGTNVVLCSKPGCKHCWTEEVVDKQGNPHLQTIIDANCDGYIGSSFYMDFGNDRLYFIESDLYGGHLMSRDATGAAEKEISILGESYLSDNLSLNFCDFVVAGNYAYCVYEISAYTVGSDPDGIYDAVGMHTNLFTVLVRVDLTTGKETVLYRNEEGRRIYIAAAKNDSVVFAIFEAPSVKDPDYNPEQLKDYPVYLYQWSQDTGKVETRLETTIDVCSTDIGLDGSKLLLQKLSYDGTETVAHTFDLKTGELKLLFRHDCMIRFLNSRYAICDNREGERYLYDIEAGKHLPIELEAPGMKVKSVGQDGFILITADVYASGAYYNTYLNYVTFRSLKDGLQESDLMPFYYEA